MTYCGVGTLADDVLRSLGSPPIGPGLHAHAIDTGDRGGAWIETRATMLHAGE